MFIGDNLGSNFTEIIGLQYRPMTPSMNTFKNTFKAKHTSLDLMQINCLKRTLKNL